MEFQWFLEKFEAFVGVNPWTMIFAWLNLLILYLFLKKLAFNPLKNMIDSRQKEIDDMYSEAEEAQKSAEVLKAEYEEKISHATEESEEILKSAVRRAQLKEEEILRTADAEAARTLERAEEQIELEKKRALGEIKDEVSSMAIGIASAVIERDVDEDKHRELIDDFINNMGNEQ
ncbi:MAG: F0F1 ATP synthase subunit B [Ruminococcaceae bacterium]|nr:F0F1 ATP synthase subunit B [Oscillospiraceae bacterium]